MRLRWLWGDYIEPDVEVTPAQRARIRERLNANADKLPNFWLIVIGMIVGGWLVLGVSQPLGQWLDANSPIANWFAHLIAIVGVGGAWTIGCILLLGVLYVPMARRSMCECGLRICIKCGYDLRAAGNEDTTCPECGSHQPMIDLVND